MIRFYFIFFTIYIFLQFHSSSFSQVVNGKGDISINTTAFTESDLPIVIIKTNGQTILDNPKIIVHMGIIYNGPGIRNYITDPETEYSGNAAIEFRGSHSQTYPKKNYGFETMDNSGTVKIDVSIFGMPSEHDWILTASYTDKSLCRDVLSYQLSMEMGHYAVRTKYVDLVVNGQYKGIYIFSESIKRDRGRVNMANLHPNEVTPPDITGGYIFKVDKITGSGGSGWTSSYPPMENSNGQTVYFQYDYPSSDSIVPVQEAYLQAYIDSFENALAGSNFRDPVKGYSRFISNGSWIDYFFVNELSKNIDGYRISTFLHKDKNRKLKAGPVWDYDLAWGNANHCNAYDTTGWAYLFPCIGDGFQIPFWWQRLLQDTNYTNEMKCRWTNYRKNVLSEQHIHSIVDSIATLLDESQEKNFEKWPILGTYIWPNPAPQPTTYAGEIQNLKNWVYTRLLWLDANIPGKCSCSISASVQNTLCNASCDGSAVALGVSPYQKTYQWSNGLESDTVTGLCAGNYTLTLNDAIGCTKSKTVVVNQPLQLSLNVNTVNSTCVGNGCNGSAIVNATGGVSPYTYSWSNGQNGSSASSLCKGTYSVTVSDKNGCTKSIPVFIQNPSAPSVSLLTLTGVTCNGGSDGAASVTVVGGTGPYTYAWSPSGGSKSSASGLSFGEYTITVSDLTGCSSQLIINIPQPAVSIFHSTIVNASCFGSTGSISVNITGGSSPYTYSWIPGGATSPILNSVSAGVYTLTATDNKGCTKSSAFTISQPSEFLFSVLTTSPNCYAGSNGSATISSTGGTGNKSYFWSPLGITAPTVSNVSAGNYTVTVTDELSCTSTTTVSIINPPEMELSTSSTPANCNLNDGVATVSVSNGKRPYQYNWYPSGSTDSSAINLNTGYQILTVIDANGCIQKDTILIVSASGLNVSKVGQTSESCYGKRDAFVNLLVTGGVSPYTYSWSPSGGTNSFASSLSPGNYSITISDVNNCVTEYQLVITEPLPVSILINSTPERCYNTATGTLNSSVFGGTSPYNYLWTPGGGTTQSVNNLLAGNYSVYITDANGCTATSSSAVSQPAPISVSISKTVARCGKGNGSAIVHASGGTGFYSYTWSNGGTYSFSENLFPGNYSVTVTDSNQCKQTSNFSLGGTPGPVVSIVNTSPISCNGGQDGSVVLNTLSDNGSITYLWTPNVSTGSVANNLSSGVYNVIVRDGSRCYDSIGFIVQEPPPISALIYTEDIKCFGSNNGLLYAEVGGGTPPYSYLWSDGQRLDSAIHLSSGTYSLLITDSYNCTASASGSISEADSMSISFDVTNATCSTCVNGSISAMVNGGILPYTFDWQPINQSTSLITNLPAGVYTLCITDGNNCLKCDSVKVEGGGVGVEEITKNSSIYIYPNPLNQYAVFAFVLKNRQAVDIRIFTLSGQIVKTIINRELDAGEQLIRFNASDLSPGIYFYQFKMETHFQAGALVISR